MSSRDAQFFYGLIGFVISREMKACILVLSDMFNICTYLDMLVQQKDKWRSVAIHSVICTVIVITNSVKHAVYGRYVLAQLVRWVSDEIRDKKG